MRLRHYCVVAALLAMAPGLWADGTIRYEASVKLGAFLTAASARSNPPADLTKMMPSSQTRRAKNGVWEQDDANAKVIFNSKSMRLTIILPDRRIFVTTGLQDLVNQLLAQLPQPKLPPQAQSFLQSMTMTFESKKTGQIGMTLGMQTEETEMTCSFNVVLPPNILAMLPATAAPPGTSITLLKIVVHMWNPTDAEVARFPALREFSIDPAVRSAVNASIANSITEMQKFLAKYPGIAQGFTQMAGQQLHEKSVMLKCNAEIYVPALALIAPVLKTQGFPAFDTSAPLIDYSIEAQDVSSAPIADSVFDVPADFHAATLAEFLQGPKPPARARPGSGGGMGPGRSRVGEPADAEGLGRLP